MAKIHPYNITSRDLLHILYITSRDLLHILYITSRDLLHILYINRRDLLHILYCISLAHLYNYNIIILLYSVNCVHFCAPTKQKRRPLPLVMSLSFFYAVVADATVFVGVSGPDIFFKLNLSPVGTAFLF